MERRADKRNGLAGALVAPLFVPGNRPERVSKARQKGARSIIIDLEDAVTPEAKSLARAQTVEVLGALSAPGVYHLVRINPASQSDIYKSDLDALTEVANSIDGIVLPKVTDADAVLALESRLNNWDSPCVPIIATIEDAVGMREVWNIAAAAQSLHTLLLGVVDLRADLNISASENGDELLTARSLLVLACSAAGLAKPIDGPHVNIGDAAGLAASASQARRLGFGGKIVLHPDQLAVVNASFAPTTEEIEWATRVVDAFERATAAGVGVVRLPDGDFIDAPVAERARAILRAAHAEKVDA